MLDSEASAILFAAAGFATLHALIPSHWLAFTMVARSQKWPLRQALAVTAIAGAGHVIVTTILGLIVATIGKTALEAIPEAAEHAATSVVLIGLGLYLLIPALVRRRDGHHDHGPFCTHGRVETEEDADAAGAGANNPRVISSRTTIATLVSGMTLSPCLDILPIYVAASRLSWTLIAIVSVILGAVTVAVMVALVGLSLSGLNRLKLPWLERHEPECAGAILLLLGAYLLME